MNDIIVEICCGSYFDGLEAFAGGARRIELNSALHLGGLTPSLAELLLLRQHTGLEIIAMARPRGAGFCYHQYDFETMYTDCRLLLEHGADGIAFGCLTADSQIDQEQTARILDLIKSHHRQAVFHRAFDCVPEPQKAIEELIHLGVDRLLTSGQKDKAPDGAPLIARLQNDYSQDIELLAGSGINAANARQLIAATGIRQIHSSCKTWFPDPTTTGREVSYAYASKPSYEGVSAELVEKLINSIQ